MRTQWDQSLEIRRGARRPVDVPSGVRVGLEMGMPSKNHMEQMALDMGHLLAAAVPELSDYIDLVRVPRFLDRMRAAASLTYRHFGDDLFDKSTSWTSDTARGWAAFAVPLAGGDVADQIARSMQFASDDHFAVREWAWLGVRPTVVGDPVGSVSSLIPFATNRDPNVRRFSSEALRPRGVWSHHIVEFKQSPELALPVINPLLGDAHRYVQDSVANWLNDASRTSPLWVRKQCELLLARTPEARYVARRAQRSLKDAAVGSAPSAP